MILPDELIIIILQYLPYLNLINVSDIPDINKAFIKGRNRKQFLELEIENCRCDYNKKFNFPCMTNLHKCICMIPSKVCRAVIHCVCFTEDDCFSSFHYCVCNFRDKCIAELHSCSCRRNFKCKKCETFLDMVGSLLDNRWDML